jgi:hypothetical protein
MHRGFLAFDDPGVRTAEISSQNPVKSPNLAPSIVRTVRDSGSLELLTTRF